MGEQIPPRTELSKTQQEMDFQAPSSTAARSVVSLSTENETFCGAAPLTAAKNLGLELGVVAHTSNLSTQEPEAGGSPGV